jgi:hypothetical protein
MNGIRQKWQILLALGFIAFLAGCQTTQPHVTAKVIFQHDDVAAEVSSEWR